MAPITNIDKPPGNQIREIGMTAGQGEQVLVDFHRYDVGSLIGQSGCQRGSAGTDFEHDVALIQFRGAREKVDQVQVDQEVLAMSRIRE